MLANITLQTIQSLVRILNTEIDGRKTTRFLLFVIVFSLIAYVLSIGPAVAIFEDSYALSTFYKPLKAGMKIDPSFKNFIIWYLDLFRTIA